MYDIPEFKSQVPALIWQFMQANPFVTLCVTDAQGHVQATQIPVLMDRQGTRIRIRGHVMRKQSHTIAMDQNPNWLLLFQGAHQYISASWYKNPEVASTWNYQSVHVRGKGEWMPETALWELLKETTRFFEGKDDSKADFEKIPVDYVQQHIKAIVGFEFYVEQIDHVFKLSQNRDSESFQRILDALDVGSEEAKLVAAAMRLQSASQGKE